MRRLLSLVVCIGLLAMGCSDQPGAKEPFTVWTNVTVHVPDSTGDGWTTHNAMAVAWGDVVALGDQAVALIDSARQQGDSVRVVDGRGAHILPGLIDAHGHVLGLGHARLQVPLVGSPSLQALQDTLRAWAGRNPHVQWVRGRGWNQELWQGRQFPTAADLDAAVADRPVVLERVDGHAVVVNTKALQLAGITRETPDPVGGKIVKDRKGNPTGLLIDAASGLVERVIPPPTAAEDSLALVTALAELRSLGITSTHDAGITARNGRLFQRFALRGELTPRIYAMIGGSGADFDTLAANGPFRMAETVSYAVTPSGDTVATSSPLLAIQAVKLYADGALGSRGAYLLDYYSDDRSTKGLRFRTDAELDSLIQKAARKGYQVCVHAIGDAANRQVLDAFQRLATAQPGTDSLRHRVEHAQVLAPGDIQRFARQQVIASMQPIHATSDKDMAEKRLGRQRLAGAYAWKTLRASGARMAFGSDYPVEPANPWLGIYATVTRKDTFGKPLGGWRPEEALTVQQALLGFTRDAAWAGHADGKLGTLRPGAWADFVVLDVNPFTLPADSLFRVRVRETWVGGKRVYSGR